MTSHLTDTHTVPSISLIFTIALTSLLNSGPESFTVGLLDVCVCVSLCLRRDRSPWPPRQTQARLTLASPSTINSDSFCPSLPLSLHLSTLSPMVWVVWVYLCVCVCVYGLPRLGERVHVSGPVKVTPYASCRDNEGFNFTTQAYQIAAPQSLRHATTTWVIWMGRHPPFHVHWAVCTVKFAKRPHHHNHRLFQSGLQDSV